jgi:hypothetical protein
MRTPSPHGTIGRYTKGCRCLACSEAGREYTRTYRRSRRGGDLILVDRELLADLLNEWFPDGLTIDSPRARARAHLQAKQAA